MADNTVLLLPHQELFLQSPDNFKDIRWHFLLAGYGAGKATPVSTLIPTPTGYRRFGDLKVGDYVFSADGKPTKVQKIFPQGMKDAYKVNLSDGRSAVCCKEHLWGVYCCSHDNYAYKVMELSEMLEKGIRRPDPRYTKAGGKPEFWLPASPVCEYPEKKLPVDPYVLGALIGNGCLTAPYLTISSNDEWQVAKTAERLGLTYKKNSSNYNWLFYKGEHYVRTDSIVPEQLCCLAGNKFIPEEYFTSSVEQRKELLQGLFDTDGSVDNSGNRLHVTYSTASKKLAEDIRTLLLSLGIVSTIRLDNREGKNTCYALSVDCAQEQKAWLFSLPRKLERITSFKRADKRDYSRVAIYSIEKLPQQMEMQCIMVEDEKHLYLTEEHIVTHNTRSLAIAALHIIAELDGEKDDGGLYAKIAVAGFTYAHLEQTFLIDFKAYLDASKTPYHEDTKDHIITVGTVQVMFLQLSEPGKIFGQSIYCFVGSTKVLTRLTNGDIIYRKLKDISIGDTVLTRAGWRRVLNVMNNGKKSVIHRIGLTGTADHRIPAAYQKNIRLQDIDGNTFFSVSKRKVKLWEELNQRLVNLKQTLSILMVCGTTDILTVLGTIEAVTTGVKAINRCIGLYGKRLMGRFLKDMSYTTKTGTLLTTLLKILSVCQKVSTARTTEKNMVALSLLRLKVRLYVMYAEHTLRELSEEGSIIRAQSTVEISLRELYSGISALLIMYRRYSGVSQLDTKSLVLTVAQCSRLLNQMLNSVLKNVGTLMLTDRVRPRSKEGLSSLLPVPFVERSLSLKDRMLDSVHSVASIFTGGVKTVYDITVEDCHEFATSSCFVHNCALADEIDELEEDVMIEAMKSVSQRVRQIMPNHRAPYIMAASTAQGMKGFYRLYSHYKKSGVGFVLIRARTQDNWYLPKEYIEDLWKNFTETERKVYMEGEFLTVTQGRVVPGFDWDKNYDGRSDMDLELIPGERVYIGMDFNTGFCRASAWVSRDGIAHCVKYYDFPDPAESAKVFRYDFPYQDIFWLPDVTSKDLYPQYARELRNYGIHIIHRTKSPLVEDSCFLLSKLCLQGRLMIHSQASEVADALATASRDKQNKIPKGVGPSSPIHAVDGARYAVSYMALVLPEYKDIRRGLMQHLPSFRRSLEEGDIITSPVKYNGAGYMQIEGEAFL